MGRGPRRERLRFRDEVNGARTREFARREEADPINTRDGNGQPIRTLDNRRRWREESERLAKWFSDLHPVTQKKVTAFVVRCPAKGCLLGRVFRRGDPRSGVRYVWLGDSVSGRDAAAIVHWAWDGGRGSKDFMFASCRHGTGRIQIGLLMDMAEALDFPPPSSRSEDWLRHYEEAVQRGYARRTIIVPDTQWTARP
ncbi:hypothetical protein ACFQ68_08910 [Amycolatopsis japonica]|uniref:hypothetical protein n=1 Tax=Amycolatopsis japonica TaxID=208439 RepID=UPI00366D83E6